MLLIFDWDGTLSDSTAKIVRCLQRAAQSAGVRVCSDDAIMNIIGLGLPECMQVLYPELPQTQQDVVKRHFSEHFMKEDQTPSPFFDGVHEGLELLRDQGHLLTVATGKSRQGLNRVLKKLQLDNFFHGSRCADETASKPDPKMLSELLDEFAVSKDEAIMIGDTEYDMSMAKQLEMPKVAVSYGAHKLTRLQEFQPLICVDHFSEFVDWVIKKY
ncbi:MAG: phosphoglycolate phosphatase [Pseudohongiellaceae bacterium]